MAKGKEIRAGGGFVTLDIRNRLAKGLSAASAQLKAFGASMTATGAMATGAGLAIVGPLLAAVGVFTTMGDQVDKVSARTGLSAEAVSELGYAASTSGGSIEALEKGNAKLGQSIDDAQQGSKKAVEGFGRLGLSVEQLAGMNPEQRFLAVADALSQVENMAERGALAQQLLGRSGRQLLPMFAGGAKGIEEMREHARALGFTIDQDTAASAAELGDRLAELWAQVKMVVFWIGSALVDDLLAFVAAAAPVLRSVIDWIKANREMIAIAFRVGAALVAVGGVLTALGLTFTLIGTAIGGLVPILGFLLSPIGLVVAALAIGAVAFFKFTETGRQALQSIANSLAPFVAIVRETFGGMFDAIAAGNWQLAGQIAIAGLRVAFVEGFSRLAAWIGGATGDLLGTIVGQLAAGDISGAWETVVLQMSAIWQGFAEGVVGVFTTAARAVVDVWQKAATAISNQILELAASKGIVGQVFSKLVGVDVSAEAARSEKMRLDEIAMQRARADRLQKQANDAEAAGDTTAAATARKQLAETEQRLAELNAAPADFVGDAQADAAGQLAGQADGFREQLDQLDRDAQARRQQATETLRGRTAGGVEAAGAAAEQANAELDALVKQAADQRKAVDEQRRQAIGEAGFELPDLGDVAADTKTETRGTFSGFAANLVAASGRRPAEERIAKGVEGMAADTKKVAKAAERGLVFG